MPEASESSGASGRGDGGNGGGRVVAIAFGALVVAAIAYFALAPSRPTPPTPAERPGEESAAAPRPGGEPEAPASPSAEPPAVEGTGAEATAGARPERVRERDPLELRRERIGELTDELARHQATPRREAPAILYGREAPLQPDPAVLEPYAGPEGMPQAIRDSFARSPEDPDIAAQIAELEEAIKEANFKGTPDSLRCQMAGPDCVDGKLP